MRYARGTRPALELARIQAGLVLTTLVLALLLSFGCGDDTGGSSDTGAPSDAGGDADADGGDGDSATPNDASADTGAPLPDGPPRLLSAATNSATTIELVFTRPVTGTNLGFTLHGTRSTEFTSLAGFGTETLIGTVADAVVYGEVVTVSYDDSVGDIEDLAWFRRELVDNGVPFEGSEVFVSADASGGGDGTESDPFTIAEINDASNIATGMRINIARGRYTTGIVVARSGAPGAPIIYEGYDELPGDTDYESYHPTYPDTLDEGNLPLIDGGSRDGGGTGAVINDKDHIVFKNIQLTRLRRGFQSSYANASHHLTFDNCATEDIGDTTSMAQGSGFSVTVAGSGDIPSDITVVNSYARNSAMANFGIRGPNAFVYGCRSYSDQDVYPGSGNLYMSTDYHYGMGDCDDAVIRESHAENVGDLEHTAHGFSIRSDETTSHRVLIDDCDAVNINGSVELRHDEVKYAIVRNVRIRGGSSRYAGGIQIRDGASFNTIDGCTVADITDGANGAIAFYDSIEQGYGQTIEGNVIMNSVFHGVNLLFRLSSGREPSFAIEGNRLYNNTFHEIDTAFRRYDNLTMSDFEGTNNAYSSVATRSYADADPGLTETYSNFTDGFAAPSGEGNQSEDPGFVNADEGNFRLGVGSALAGAGVPLDEVAHDFDGEARHASVPSIGAFE